MKKGWWTQKEERIFWEKWIIPISVNNSKINKAASAGNGSSSSNSANSSQSSKPKVPVHVALHDRMVHIITCVNEKKEHIPPLKTNAANMMCTFPFTISWTTGSDSN